MQKRQLAPEEVLTALEDDDLDAEAERSAKMSDAEIDADLRRAGVDPNEVSAGAARVFEQAMKRRSPPHPARKRIIVPALAMAAAASVLVGTFVAQSPMTAVLRRSPNGGGVQASTEQLRAKELRAQAADLCAAHHFVECRDRLDQARAIDPPGEQDDRVVVLRRVIAEGLVDAGP